MNCTIPLVLYGREILISSRKSHAESAAFISEFFGLRAPLAYLPLALPDAVSQAGSEFNPQQSQHSNISQYNTREYSRYSR